MTLSRTLLLFSTLLAFAPLTHAKYTSATPPTSGPTVPGDRAVVVGGIAHAPENAPEAVKRAIWATNFLTRKPYVWGGGHGSFYENGYDCSGTVSFLLRHAGVLSSPAGSRELTQYGERGSGRWITIYARDGHVWPSSRACDSTPRASATKTAPAGGPMGARPPASSRGIRPGSKASNQ